MIAFTVRRLLAAVALMFGLSVIVFLIFFATPGIDPARQIAGKNPNPATIKAIRADFSLDQPLPTQYVRLMNRLVIKRDLESYSNRGVKVIPELLDAAPVTLALVLGAGVVWLLVSVLLGVVAAVERGTLWDKGLMVLALIGISMPPFWLGEVANLLTQDRWHDVFLFSWVPTLGWTPLADNPGLWFRHLVIPWLVLATLYVGLYARVLRASILDMENADFVRTARAKGISGRRVLVRHVLRNSLISFVSVFGLDFGALVGGGALLVEVVFGLPGIGRLTYNSLGNLDLPVIMATVLYGGFFIVLVNAAVDVLYARLDPRGAGGMTDDALLTVHDLRVTFDGRDGPVRAVDGVSFDLAPNEVLGIVGESGSGKSATVMGTVGLLGPAGRAAGEVRFGGRDLLGASEDALRQVRGAGIAMVFQDPMTSLNPVYTVGWQIAEQLREHQDLSAAQARDRTIALLESVGIPDPASRVDAFPHELSGGMRQRVMIALALSCNPSVLIADEPTTALDVTIQAQILDLIRGLRTEHGSSVVLITHDMGVIAEMADRVLVMYGGKVVEQASTRALFRDPQHPYTWGLLGSIPRLDQPRPRRLAAIPPPEAGWVDQPGACVFASRCPHRFDACAEMPELTDKRGDGHLDACRLPIERRAALREAR